MSDESIAGTESAEQTGLSRRAALRAGVAAGVGVAAWSGVTITSLGGTPAYAVNCTGAGAPIPLLDCRNTDQGNCKNGLRYHTLKSVPPPYGVTNNITENSGICCSDFQASGGTVPNPYFTFPTTQKCAVYVEFYIGGDTSCENRNIANRTGIETYGPDTSGSLELDFGCPLNDISGTKMTIFAICTNAAFPDECFTLPPVN